MEKETERRMFLRATGMKNVSSSFRRIASRKGVSYPKVVDGLSVGKQLVNVLVGDLCLTKPCSFSVVFGPRDFSPFLRANALLDVSQG